ncbi:Crp/Fnr family transcriptional regulator [Paenibacillus harenae]|uniref:Crp/Fnr family transcriptional regulator n=1 Tax=Paenibacillus harenae TaxID=306543 RepID=UPI001FE17F25|nr:cyclic nucleotide-binding domain-containing protein [Paenibacillus harenae]
MEQDRRIDRYAVQYKLNEIFDPAAIASMRLLSYSKGEAVCSAGDHLDHLYLLVKGKTKVYTTLPNGKSVLLRFNEPLAVVGDMELMTGNPVQCMVESVGESLFLAISKEALRDTAFQSPRFLSFIIKQLSHKLYTASNASSLNLLYPVENRFASYLVSVTSDDPHSAALKEIKTDKLTEVAEKLGTSYRHLNRVIAQLARSGIVERERGAVYIRDLERLKELASGNLYS